METITLQPLQHNQEENIALFFSNVALLNKAVRTIKKVRWSQTNKCWYVPLNKEKHTEIVAAFKGLAKIEQTVLRKYLLEKKKIKPTIAASIKKTINLPVTTNKTIVASGTNYRKELFSYKGRKINGVNAHILPAMEQQLKLKAYSSSTIKTYLSEMTQLLQTLDNIPADDLSAEHLKRYLLYCYEKLLLKENTLHSRINAMKFYYEQVLGRAKFFWEIPRPKKALQLPKILSEKELGRLFMSIENLKHKAIVFTAYSAGLRVSEVVHLKIKDIDSGRMTLFIQNAKGKKDRIVNLSPLLLDILRSYLRQQKPKPLQYLFEGDIPGNPYSIRSAQQIFHTAKKKAEINKEISFHGLRHSFATHLLEKGVDIRYIKDILGHFDIKTTERYTHVSKRMLVNIGSPLDDLFSKGLI